MELDRLVDDDGKALPLDTDDLVVVVLLRVLLFLVEQSIEWRSIDDEPVDGDMCRSKRSVLEWRC